MVAVVFFLLVVFNAFVSDGHANACSVSVYCCWSGGGSGSVMLSCVSSCCLVVRLAACVVVAVGFIAAVL